MSARVLGFLALLAVGLTTAVWFRAALQLHLPRNRSGFVAGWLAGVALGLFALFGDPGWAGGAAAVLATAAGAFLSFTVAISRQQVGEGAIRVGDPMPDFEAPDARGEAFAAASLAGRPVLLKFFRGHW